MRCSFDDTNMHDTLELYTEGTVHLSVQTQWPAPSPSTATHAPTREAVTRHTNKKLRVGSLGCRVSWTYGSRRGHVLAKGAASHTFQSGVRTPWAASTNSMFFIASGTASAASSLLFLVQSCAQRRLLLGGKGGKGMP